MTGLGCNKHQCIIYNLTVYKVIYVTLDAQGKIITRINVSFGTLTSILPLRRGLTKTCKTTQTDYKAMKDKDCYVSLEICFGTTLSMMKYKYI